ncbi:MAG: hypothetical protein HYV63_24240, partial [Candidatus Schekmanbacteria bacterium]|nr:hypothetical protein [Candidatus Schekmanbacteria bacterium]
MWSSFCSRRSSGKLKSGCRIQDRQLETAEALRRAMGIDLVVAWRIYYLTKLGRETPN